MQFWMMARSAGALLLVFVACLSWAANEDKGLGRTADAGSRLALVIGNNDYENAPLKNPINDARAMKATLEKVGFKVIYIEDANYETMDSAVTTFAQSLRKDSVALFYYSGHGVQAGGFNYLIPAKERINSEEALRYHALNAQFVLDGIQKAGSRVNIVILDACRNNPFIGFKSAASDGLVSMSGPAGTLIAFATAPGKVAADGVGSNSAYTKHLVDALLQQNVKIEDMFKQVRQAVSEETHGGQVPWEHSSLVGDFCFAGSQCGNADTDPVDLKEQALWNTVKANKTLENCSKYLKQYPVNGQHTGLAKNCVEALVENEFWESVKDSKDPKDFREYLDKYPTGQFVSIAKSKADPEQPGTIKPPCQNCTKPEMVVIKGGDFLMGAEEGDKDARSNEKPRHKVTIQDFSIGIYEVKQAEYINYAQFTDTQCKGVPKRIEDKSKSKGRDIEEECRSVAAWLKLYQNQASDHPAVGLSFEDAQNYVKWLREQTGKPYRLPTEAEWEYAARAGLQTSRYWGNNVNSACDYANVYDKALNDELRGKPKAGPNNPLRMDLKGNVYKCDDQSALTARVGKFKPNSAGLYDMLGNVWEWTCSKYTDYNHFASTETRCDGNASDYVARGGSWMSFGSPVRFSFRHKFSSDYTAPDLGFRLAL